MKFDVCAAESVHETFHGIMEYQFHFVFAPIDFLRSINLLTKERNVKATQRRGNQTEAKAIGLIIVKDDIKSKKLRKTLQCVYIFKFH